MNLKEKAEAVKALFVQLDKDTQDYRENGGLGCLSGCGFCCSRPKISAYPIEFLPFAYDLVDKGLAEQALAFLEENPDLDHCMNFVPKPGDNAKGFCGTYSTRGLICRVFGTAARKTKTGTREIIICKPLKEERAEQLQTATRRINSGELQLPLATDYYAKIADLDSYLSTEMPINQAIRIALDRVLREIFYASQEVLD
ncbi:YkgJ family cysteine cluster protein [Algoriphagus namhaensis]|uniref:YkgJ family cysteine cluster protein n=1 Tax=Algoriphagus namhaensis TaxID=915353 RepID=A0ABV8AS08_9BACT